MKKIIFFCFILVSVVLSAQNKSIEKMKASQISEPLVTDIFTADPSAHVFDGKLYIYPSHDVTDGISDDAPGGGFGMVDYHVFSMTKADGKVKDHGQVLHVDDVPWAKRMMWAPDAATKDGKCYLYFPAKNEWGIFQIGVAVGDSPSGPFVAQPEPIKGSYSIDPSVFKDDDGEHYMYFGGIDGGQLQNYKGNDFGLHYTLPKNGQPALRPRIAKMSDDMLQFAEASKEIIILDENGEELKVEDGNRRFFEASWMHKYNGNYYFSYSTGTSHMICYAIGDSPYGPFTYQGVVLKPVLGWTNHHSICEFKGKWYLFYHDSMLSGGNTVLRSIKMTELTYDADGKIKTIDAYANRKKMDVKKDMLLVNYDCKTDVDDLHSIAAFATLLSDSKYAKMKYHAVVGAYGTQGGLYVPPNDLCPLAFGDNWTDAHNDFDKAVQKVTPLLIATLSKKGDIWISEAGQSDFSAAVIKGVQKEMSDLKVSERIHIVQHSGWNEKVTTPEALDFVKQNTDYCKITDGNAVGNGTPGFRDPDFTAWETEVKSPELHKLWQLAYERGNQYSGKDGRYANKAVEAGGLDFSDTAEICWILGIEDIADVAQFFELFAK